MPTRPRREKRIHRQHYEQHCRWILFLWKRKARIRCACEKTGEARRWRSEPRAARTGRKKVGWRGMKKSEDALSKRAENQKSARRIKKHAGESKKHAGESKNKWRAIEKQGIAESKRRGRNPKERGDRNPKACGQGIRKRAICPPPCRDEGFG